MKHLSQFVIILNIYFIIGGLLGILLFLSNPNDYVFGTEVAGFSYNSSTHHIFTQIAVFLYGVLGLVIHKFKLLNELKCAIVCLLGLVLFAML